MKHGCPQKTVQVVGAALVHEGRCLVTRRSALMSAPLKWEFPGGKIEEGESPAAALRRELREELGVEIEVGPKLGQGEGHVNGRHICLEVYAARWTGGQIHLREHQELGWFGASELDQLDWPEADLPLLPAVKAYLNQ